MAAMAVAAVAGAGFVVTRDNSPSVIVEDATEIVSDPDVDGAVAYSFAAATSSAQASASVVFEMDIESPDGPMSATASFDRDSGRLAMDLDLTDLVQDDEIFEIGDSISFIIDEQSGAAYVSAGFLGEMFGPVDGWVSISDDGFSLDDEAFTDVFSNPLNIADVFGDVEPIDLGEETIDGEVLRHFEVMLDSAALAELGEDSIVAPDISQAAMDITYDVWVDEASQIRRIVFDATSEGEVGTVDMWITFSGDPIDIALPTPDEVVSLEELFAGAFDD